MTPANSEMNRRITDVAGDLEQCKTEVGQQMQNGNKRMKDLENKIDLLDQKIEGIKVTQEQFSTKVSLLIDILEAGEGAIKVLSWLGTAVKWLAGIGISFAAITYFLKTGHWK